MTVITLWAPLLPLGSSAAALRMLRLLRLAKLAEKSPKLRAQIAGLAGGMKEIGYINIMTSLLHIYAILGHRGLPRERPVALPRLLPRHGDALPHGDAGGLDERVST